MLSVMAERLLEHFKRNDGFITMSYARSYMSGVNELLDSVKIAHFTRDGVDGFRLLKYQAPTQQPRIERHGVRRFIVGEGGIHEYNGADTYKDKTRVKRKPGVDEDDRIGAFEEVE